MEPYILQNLNFAINLEKLCEAVHIEQDDELYEDFLTFCEKAQRIANPKAVFKVCSVNENNSENMTDIDGVLFKSRIMKVNVAENRRVFVYVATCGVEFDSIDISDNPIEEYWLDSIKFQALGFIMTKLMAYFKETFGISGTGIMNPGSLEDDFALIEQKKLFSIIDTPEKYIGVKLAESLLMYPLKSVSGILFETDKDYENCMLCPRKDCPNRRAPYDEMMMNIYK